MPHNPQLFEDVPEGSESCKGYCGDQKEYGCGVGCEKDPLSLPFCLVWGVLVRVQYCVTGWTACIRGVDAQADKRLCDGVETRDPLQNRIVTGWVFAHVSETQIL